MNGSEAAPMTVVEFSDFRCPYCRRAADLIKIVAANNRDRARFVFRHYPLDASCNPNVQRDLHPGDGLGGIPEVRERFRRDLEVVLKAGARRFGRD